MKKTDFDIRTFLTANVGDLIEHGKHEVSIACYSCGDVGDHMWVNVSTGAYICYRCGESGYGVKLISKLAGVPWDQATEMIESAGAGRGRSQLGGVKERLQKLHGREDQTATQYKYARRLPSNYERLPAVRESASAQRAYDYLIDRGVTDEMIQRYQLGYCKRGRYQGRVVIPILSYGRPIYFVARDFTGRARAKVLTPPNEENYLSAREVIYNMDDALRSDTLIITEGVFDAMATGGIALLGKRISPTQYGIIMGARASWESVVIMFDGDDPEAPACSQVAARALGSRYDVRIADLPPGEDPASVDDPAPFVAGAKENNSILRLKMKIRRSIK